MGWFPLIIILLNEKIIVHSSTKMGNRKKYTLSQSLISIVQEVLTRAVKEVKSITDIQKNEDLKNMFLCR